MTDSEIKSELEAFNKLIDRFMVLPYDEVFKVGTDRFIEAYQNLHNAYKELSPEYHTTIIDLNQGDSIVIDDITYKAIKVNRHPSLGKTIAFVDDKGQGKVIAGGWGKIKADKISKGHYKVNSKCS